MSSNHLQKQILWERFFISMMRFWGCLFLIVTPFGSGEPTGLNDTVNQELPETTVDHAILAQTLAPTPVSGAHNGSSHPQLTSPTPQSQTPANENVTTTRDQTTTTYKRYVTREEVNSSTAAPETVTHDEKEVMTHDKDTSTWVYVFLVLIPLIILVLVVILYLLQRSTRTYSFDLQRPLPVNHPNDQNHDNETFGPIYLDDLSLPPVDNKITPLKPVEQNANGEGAPQEQPIPNGLETTLTSKTNPTLDPSMNSPVSSTHLFLGDMGAEPLNENNNNPPLCSGDPFVEISLDDVASCDHLLELI